MQRENKIMDREGEKNSSKWQDIIVQVKNENGITRRKTLQPKTESHTNTHPLSFSKASISDVPPELFSDNAANAAWAQVAATLGPTAEAKKATFSIMHPIKSNA